ncbi:unnamed protein product [Withania somnifera]
MESLSPAIGQKAILPSTTSRHSNHDLFLTSVKSRTVWNLNRSRQRLRIRAVAGTGSDFSDPDWKLKYQREFEARFNIPHITDVFHDAISYPSTFCLKMRTPVTEEFAEGYPSDEKWHGYINNNDRVLLKGSPCRSSRENIFQAEEVKAAIVTCGGLCPGLNDVIRQIVITLEIYGVKKIVGIPFGYRGFSEKDLAEMPARGINMLFVLGGNGTHAGANAIHNECRKRRMKVAVVGVPKTIDNDIMLMDKTFGFDTAVEEAQRAINSAYIEAHSAYRGIGIVKLMGRSSGFIAMQASLASGQIDICLIPEVPFNLHGPHGVLRHLKYLLEKKGSAVVCAAEGAGQDFLEKTNAKDASGNAVLGDIGVYLQQEVKKYFKELGEPADVKYIDPTYMIRACRANASDGILCTVLGQNAVHGAFAGYSGITVGICNTHYVYFPIPEVISKPKVVDPNSRMWHRCLTSTGQPDFL